MAETAVAGGAMLHEALLDEIAAQRSRIAYFEPVLFHAHSIDSHDWAKRPGADSTRNDRERLKTEEGIQEFLNELARHYRIVCITDHMKSAYADRLARAAAKRDDITVFPGMEINCLTAPAYADAIHLLAIFPPETGEIGIERIFHGKGLGDPRGRKGNETVRFDDLRELRDRIRREANGLFVLAHVENSKRGHRARFRADRGQTLAIFSDAKQLDMTLADEYRVYLARLLPDAVELQKVADQHHYARFIADNSEHQLACVAPADHHSLEEYDVDGSATLLKIPRCDFASVREALRFHETRVRLPGQATDHQAPRLVGLRLASPNGTGLFLDTTMAFSPNLTCLIGPRGSGKSTVIEALRYLLGRNGQLDGQARDRDRRGYAELALGTQAANLTDTRLELLYEKSGGEKVVLAATFDGSDPEATRGFTLAGTDLRLSADALREDFPVAIFSWSEMEVLGRESGPQRDLVDRLLGDIGPLIAERDATLRELLKNRAEIQSLVADLRRRRDAHGRRLARYVEYRNRYNAINTREAAALFENLDVARKRGELLDSVREALVDLETQVAELRAAGLFKRLTDLVDAADPEISRWWDEEPARALNIQALDARLVRLADELSGAVSDRLASVAEFRRAATDDTRAVEQQLRTQTSLDDGQDVLRDQRERARTRFELVDADRTSYLEVSGRLEFALATREALVADLDDALTAISETRERNLSPLNQQLADVGGEQMTITVERDRLADRLAAAAYVETSLMNQERGGQYRHRRIAERLCRMARPGQLSNALVASDVTLLGQELMVGAEGALDQSEADKLIGGCVWKTWDEDAEVDVYDDAVLPFLRLAEQPIDDRVRIKLNGRPVDELSPGQRSSAMLPLIALAETDPLVIDQPEDNLDNAMVGETLTRILADLKERRQIIVSTHNPNIVVGGDAEQVVVLQATAARRAAVEHTGSIDDDGIIKAVLKIMEGGREAFIARKKRYRVP